MYFQSFPAPLFVTLDRIRECLHISEGDFADLLEVTQDQWTKIKCGVQDAELHSVLLLSERFDLSLEAIFQGDIDYLALSQKFAQGSVNLPEKYETLKTSRVHTALNLLNFIEETKGPLAGLRILKRLQLHPRFLINPISLLAPLYSRTCFRSLQKQE
jgi:hypothetical protein